MNEKAYCYSGRVWQLVSCYYIQSCYGLPVVSLLIVPLSSHGPHTWILSVINSPVKIPIRTGLVLLKDHV